MRIFLTLALLLTATAGCSDDETSSPDSSTDGSQSTPDTSTADGSAADGSAADSSAADANSSAAKTCANDEDCVLATDYSRCCPESRCPSSYNVDYVESEQCIGTSASDAPEQCVPRNCGECPGPPFTCADAERAVCIGDRCETAGPK